MKLTIAELGYVRSWGIYAAEGYADRGKLLNEAARYTIAQRPEVCYSAKCRDLAFFGGHHEARRHSTPGKCAYCGDSLLDKRRGALYCDEICKKRATRAGRRHSAGEAKITGTASQSNQQLADTKTVDVGDCTVCARPASKSTLVGALSESKALVCVEADHREPR